VDRITDFSQSEGDRILLSGSDFGLSAGVLPAALFKDAAAAVEDGDDRVLYNHETGGVYYDRDGLGGADPVIFAVLDSEAFLSAADITVV
jgi:Ca2+-binding RTX toxin-like protein